MHKEFLSVRRMETHSLKSLETATVPITIFTKRHTCTRFGAASSRSFFKTQKDYHIMMKSLPWTFWSSMKWQSHINNRIMPGWRWCFSILSMMKRQSGIRIDTGSAKSNLLKVAVLNECQSENAASLFKSIRVSGCLSVVGGLLFCGGGECFFSIFLKQSSFNPNQMTC